MVYWWWCSHIERLPDGQDEASATRRVTASQQNIGMRGNKSPATAPPPFPPADCLSYLYIRPPLQHPFVKAFTGELADPLEKTSSQKPRRSSIAFKKKKKRQPKKKTAFPPFDSSGFFFLGPCLCLALHCLAS